MDCDVVVDGGDVSGFGGLIDEGGYGRMFAL